MNKYKILTDSREKRNEYILQAFKKHNVEYEIKKLNFGDYAIQDETGFRPNLVIERKASLDELIGNIFEKCDEGISKNRIHKEFTRAIATDTRVLVLIEDSEWYEKLLKGNYRSQANPKALTGLIMSLKAKYPYYLSIIGIDKEYAASFIHNTLKYELMEQLKLR